MTGELFTLYFLLWCFGLLLKPLVSSLFSKEENLNSFMALRTPNHLFTSLIEWLPLFLGYVVFRFRLEEITSFIKEPSLETLNKTNKEKKQQKKEMSEAKPNSLGEYSNRFKATSTTFFYSKENHSLAL